MLYIHSVYKDTLMKSFTQYITESVDASNLPNSVLIGQTSGQAAGYGGFNAAIATIQQKQANKDQSLFSVSAYDIKEFGKLLKGDDVLCRLSTPMTSNSNDEYRSICIVNVKATTIRFVDNDKYEDGKIVSTRANKFKWLNIDPDKVNYFKIVGMPDGSKTNY